MGPLLCLVHGLCLVICIKYLANSQIRYPVLDPLNPHENHILLIHVKMRKKKEREEQLDASYLLN